MFVLGRNIDGRQIGRQTVIIRVVQSGNLYSTSCHVIHLIGLSTNLEMDLQMPMITLGKAGMWYYDVIHTVGFQADVDIRYAERLRVHAQSH